MPVLNSNNFLNFIDCRFWFIPKLWTSCNFYYWSCYFMV